MEIWHTHRQTDRQTKGYTDINIQGGNTGFRKLKKKHIGFNIFWLKRNIKSNFTQFGVLMPGLKSLLIDTQIIHYVKMMEAEFFKSVILPCDASPNPQTTWD